MQCDGLFFIFNTLLQTMSSSIFNMVFSHESGQEFGFSNQFISLAYLIASAFLSELFHHCAIVYYNFQSYKFIHFLCLIIQHTMNYKSCYDQKELVGRGQYGRVHLVYHRKTSQPFVAKKIDFQGMSKQEQEGALKQVNIHKKLKHKNILQFKEYFVEDETLIMIMEYCQFGDLSVYIKQRKQKGEFLEEALIVNLFVQMLFGLNYLHESKILHRDVKTQNIFIDSEGVIKLADFGISKILQHTQHLASTVIGTPYYLSPEACSSSGYSFKSDIWSLGCVLYELCSLEHPFTGDNILILAKKISTEQPKEIPNKYSSQLKQLIKLMQRKSAEERPTIKQIIQTKYISDYLTQCKMQNPINQNTYSQQQNEDRDYPIFQTCADLENNEFMDLEYERGKVQKIPSSPSKTKQHSKRIDQVAISPQKSRAYNLRQKCIQKMGDDLFNQIYSFMRIAQTKNINESKVQELLKAKYTKKQFQMSMDIAQLLYLEQVEGK